jgi:hypothetical protein
MADQDSFMKQQRLQHQADILAHMACGWRVVNDLRQLAELGRGRIEMDALTGNAQFEDRPLSRFSLGKELAAWLARDGQDNGVPLEHIRRARVSLDFAATLDAARKTISLSRRAKSVVETDERTFTGTFEKAEEPGYSI